MVKIKCLKDIPKDKQLAVQALAESCMANEESMNTDKICWFILERFYQRFKNKLVVYDETKKDGIRGAAILHFEKGNVLFVSHVYVKRKFRCYGIGSALMKAAIAFGKKNKRIVSLNVNPRNPAAISLYNKLGFVPEPEQSIRMSIAAK